VSVSPSPYTEGSFRHRRHRLAYEVHGDGERLDVLTACCSMSI